MGCDWWIEEKEESQKKEICIYLRDSLVHERRQDVEKEGEERLRERQKENVSGRRMSIGNESQ